MLTNNNQQEAPRGGGSHKRRRIRLPKHCRLTKRLILETDELLEYVPPERLSRNLRNLLLSYLDCEKDHPLYFEDLVVDLYFLFQFLDVATDELGEEQQE
jgi:hypothetical protein